MVTRRIAVEISTTAVRMAEISASDRKLKLLAWSQVELPRDAIVEGAVARPEIVRRAIAACVEQGGFKRGRLSPALQVSLSVAGLRAITREIEMPKVPTGEIDAAVKLQALDIIPFPVEKTLLSARPLATLDGADGTPHMRVLLAAAHRDLVDPLVEVVEKAGLVPVSVDLSSSALVRALWDPKEGIEGAQAIVAVGADLTTVVVHSEGEPHFVRTMAGGGNAVTRAIASALDLPLEDAEALKFRLGMPPGPSARIPPDAISAARDASALLIADIRSSVEYYATLPGRSEVRRIVVTGGGTLLAGFVERLQSQMRAPVVVGRCFGRFDTSALKLDLDRFEPVSATVLGLALPEPAGVKTLDLLPPDIVVRRKQKRVERVMIGAAAGIFLLLGVTAFHRFVQVHNAENGIGQLQSSVSQVQAQIPKYNKVQQEDHVILSDEGIGKPIVEGEVYWPSVFSALAQYTPSSITSTGFAGTASAPAAGLSASAPVPAPTAGGATTAATVTASGLPTSQSTIGTFSLNLAGAGYPAFQSWFDAIQASNHFSVLSYSGISASGASPSVHTGITFTAQLGITGLLHTNRLSEFEVYKQ